MTKFFNDQGGLRRLRAHLGLAKAKMAPDVRDAHEHCSKHRPEILSSASCGCFYCLECFGPHEIDEWIEEEGTALCPRCGIDSVIGSASGFVLTKEFLKEMNDYWFGESPAR